MFNFELYLSVKLSLFDFKLPNVGIDNFFSFVGKLPRKVKLDA